MKSLILRIKWWYIRHFRPRPNNTTLHPYMDNRALYNFYPAALPDDWNKERERDNK